MWKLYNQGLQGGFGAPQEDPQDPPKLAGPPHAPPHPLLPPFPPQPTQKEALNLDVKSEDVSIFDSSYIYQRIYFNRSGSRVSSI